MAYIESSSVSAAAYKGQKASTAEESILQNVNIYRGAVDNSIKLVSLDGPDGLDITLSLNYQPSDGSFFKSNGETVSSVAGWGYTLPVGAIWAQNTGTRCGIQSAYTLNGEGGSFPLYRLDADGDAVAFCSVAHPNWKISRYADRWEILRDDGSRWIYGGTEDSCAVRVYWGNWGGPCCDAGGEAVPIGWLLSSVVSRYGHTISFTYENIRKPLGGAEYTSEIHLGGIESAYGQKVRLHYQPKEDSECAPYCDVEWGSQRLDERHYLERVDVCSESNELLYAQVLSYELVSAAKDEVKRLLTAVSQVTPQEETLPPLAIRWHREGMYAGHLQGLTYPRGASLSFEYEPLHAEDYEPATFLDCSSEWTKNVYHGSDFTAVLLTRKQDASARLFLLSWDMTWQQFEDCEITACAVEEPVVVLGNGIVALRYRNPRSGRYHVRILKRVPVRRYDWEAVDLEIDDTGCPSVVCGEDFAAIQYAQRNGLLVYQFNYLDNAWHSFTLPVDAMGHQVIGTGQGCVFGAYGDEGSSNVRIVTFYCDEKHEWKVGGAIDVPADVSWTYTKSLPVWTINGSIASACFFAENGNEMEATLLSVAWDEAFQIRQYDIQRVQQSVSAGNPIYFSIATDTMIGFANIALRYTPQGYVQHELFQVKTEATYAYAYGDDLILGVEKMTGGRQRFAACRFDPAQGGWTDDGVPYAEDINDDTGICRPFIASGYAVLGRYFFHKGADGRWQQIDFLPAEADVKTVRIDPAGGYCLYGVPQANLVRFIPLGQKGTEQAVELSGVAIDDEAGYSAGMSCCFAKNVPGQVEGLRFYTLVKHRYEPQLPMTAMLAQVVLDSGLDRQTIHLAYHSGSVRLEEGRAAVGEAYITPASADGLFGKTTYRYYTGTSPSRFHYPDTDEDCNVGDFYTHFAGQQYEAVYEDGDGHQVRRERSASRAFDCYGFHIKPTRVEQTHIVPRVATDGKETGERDENTTILRYEYDQSSGRRNKACKRVFDRYGNPVDTVQTIRYASESCAEMAEANLLNDVSMTVTKDVAHDRVISRSRYDWQKNREGRYYRAAEYAMGRSEEEWLQVSRVGAVDAQCKPLCEYDERGLPTSTCYDISGRFPVAVTHNAEPETVLYCGFEAYECIDKLQVSGEEPDGYLTTQESFSGERSLCVPRGKSLSASVKAADGSLRLRVSVKTEGTLTLRVKFDEGTVHEKSIVPGAGWMSLYEAFYARDDASDAEITLSADEMLYVDALYITPALADGEAYVYTGAKMLQTALHRNNAPGSKTWYDRLEVPCLALRDDGGVDAVTNTIFHGGNDPIERYTVKPTLHSAWYDARIGCPETQLFVLKDDGWTFAPKEQFALVFLAKSRKTLPVIEMDAIRIAVQGDEWCLNRAGDVQHAAVPDGRYYMLLRVGDRCAFYGESTLLFTFTASDACTSLSLSGGAGIICMGYIPQPGITFSYGDLSGRIHQDQVVTEQGLRIVHTIYNELGIQVARTIQSELCSEMWGYRDGFVTGYDTQTGRVTGEICSLYPEAEGYACLNTRPTLSAQPYITEMALPGKGNILGSATTLRRLECSLSGFSSLMSDGNCIGNLTTDMDGIRTLNLKDGRGDVLSAKLSASGECTEITAYEVDERGNKTKIYLPNFFTVAENADQYVSTITYDELGHITSRKDPDTALVRTVYDRFGDLKFILQDESSGQYIYHLYDRLGRKTEIGYVTGEWDDEALRAAADRESTRPAEGVPVRRMYYDEMAEDGSAAGQLGRLTRVETVTNGQLVTERYAYDMYGRQTKYTLETDGRQESCLTAYDEAGNVIERRTGREEDGVLNYRYGMSGELTAITYNGCEIYSCAYTAAGHLAEERLGKGIRRSYQYDLADRLTQIKDNYLNQQITYGDAKETAYDANRIVGVHTSFSDKRSGYTRQQTLSAAYDELGRLARVEMDNSKEWQFSYDANGNLQREDLSYVPGTDRLASVSQQAVTYEENGAVREIGSRLSLQYDSVIQQAVTAQVGQRKISYRAGTARCGYDEGKGLTLCVKSEDGKLFFERGSDGEAVILVRGANGVFAQIRAGKVFSLIRDYRSSVCGIADDSGLLAAYDYDPFGGILSEWEAEEGTDGLIPFRFAGARDEGEGIYRFAERLYDSVTGRFLSIDPQGQYSNPYLYGGCDWINYTDPDGAFSWGGFFASLVTGIALIAIGVAVTTLTAGLGGAMGVALGVVAGGIIGAGIASTIYSVTSAINDDFSWSHWGVQIGMGAVFGMVTAGIGAAMPTTMGAVASVIYDGVSGMIVGASDGVVTNGMLNVIDGKAFWDNHSVTNAIVGAVLGGFLGAATRMSRAARNARNVWRSGGFAKDVGSDSPPLNSDDFAQRIEKPDYYRKMRGTNKKPVEKIPNYTNDKFKKPDELVNYERNSKIFNSSTEDALSVSAEAGSCQPLWARSPSTLDLWNSFT